MNSVSDKQLFQILSDILQTFGFVTKLTENWLVHEETGLFFAPELLYAEPAENNASTGTVIQIFHPDLFPDSIFEYQYYSWETDVFKSLAEGFKQWIETDLLLLVDALKPDNHDYMTMTMEKENGASSKLLFGNVIHFGESDISNSHDEHDNGFCPCCLFTNCIDSFKPLLDDNQNYAVRLFAYKNADTGEIDADCRVNGEEFENAKPALINYAKTWQSKEIEFRKQYMLIIRGSS